MEKSKTNITSMRIDRNTLIKLDALKIIPRETYEELIRRLLKAGEKVDI